MTSDAFDKLRSQLLSLSEAERAELAHELIKSLDAPQDGDVAGAWDAEIRRRIAQIDAGQAQLLSRAEFAQRMRAKTGRQ